MKFRFASFITLVALSLIVVSCKKSSSGSDKSKTELLSQGVWKFHHAGLDTDGNGTIDAPLPPTAIQSCETDNTISFSSNGSGIVDEGPTKCNGANPQTVPFTWSFKNNETIINFSNPVFSQFAGDVKLLGVTDDELTLQKDVNIGITVNLIVVLRH